MSAEQMFSVVDWSRRQPSERPGAQLADQVPVFIVYPGDVSTLKHFAAKMGIRVPYGLDPIFRISACVGQDQGIPVVVGIIQVGKRIDRKVGDSFQLEVHALVHDNVPGVREFLYRAAQQAGRALGFHALFRGGIQDADPEFALLSALGFVRPPREPEALACDLVHRIEEASTPQQTARLAIPERPIDL